MDRKFHHTHTRANPREQMNPSNRVAHVYGVPLQYQVRPGLLSMVSHDDALTHTHTSLNPGMSRLLPVGPLRKRMQSRPLNRTETVLISLDSLQKQHKCC